jgi:hypothetical protein
MAAAALISLPCLDRDDREGLRDLEGILQRHPYMRADLGAVSSLSKELEDVVSARLAWLHLRGPRRGSRGSSLPGKLRDREAALVRALAAQEAPGEALLRYETMRLLHPEPGTEHAQGTVSARLAEAIEQWERLRQGRPLRAVLAEKWRQSRSFVRHGAMLPLYWARRRRIRARLPRAILVQPALRETFFAVEQIGPIVDSFAFEGAAGAPVSTSVGLADVAFLYMQLADEFLDELAAAAGSHQPVGRLIASLHHGNEAERPLRGLTVEHVRAIGVEPLHHATRFGLTLAELLETLDDLAETIDALASEADRAVTAATLRFLHHCFETYLDEIELCSRSPGCRPDRMPLQDAAWHFYRKNNLVMMLWLDLRARSLGLEPVRHADAIRRWGYLLASFQIFDDLKDLAVDLGRQPNYALQTAAWDFPRELAWIERRFGGERRQVTRDEVAELSLRAHHTVEQCKRWSRLIALAHFDNVLLYAWDQRWKKSWTRRRNSFNPEGGTLPRPRVRAVDRLIGALQIAQEGGACAIGDEQLAFALDAAAYESRWQIHLALFPNVLAMYRFATLQMWMTAEEKARIARRLLRRFSRSRAVALPGLGDGDVDHQVGRDGLEAFSKVLEAQALRRPQARLGLEQGVAGPGRAVALGVQLVDVHTARGERFGDLVHDPRSVAADEIEQDEVPLWGCLFRASLDDHAQASRAKPFERLRERLGALGRNARAQDAGEMTRQARHAALHPAPTVLFDDGRDRLDQPRPILANHRDDEGLHPKEADAP